MEQIAASDHEHWPADRKKISRLSLLYLEIWGEECLSGKLVKSSVVLFILMLASKVLVIVRDMALAAVFGASTQSDAYVIAVTILTLVGVASLASLVVAYIPIVSGKDEDTLNYITNNYMTVLSGVTLLLSLITLCFTRPLIGVFAPGFEGETVAQTESILRITLPFLFFNVMLNISIAYLQNRGTFWYQGFSAVIANVIIIVSVLLSRQKLTALAVGYTLSIVLPALCGLLLASNSGFRPRIEFSLRNKYLRELVMLAIPIFFSQVLIQLNIIVDKNFSSKVGTGIVTGMDYAHKITDAAVSTAVPAIGTVLFPKMSRQAATRDVKFTNTLGQGLCAMTLVLFPLMAGAMVLSGPIVDFLFLRGNYSVDAAGVTADALFYYAAGILPLGLAHTLNNGFFAMKDTKTPIKCGAVATVLNIFLDFILVRKFSYRGLAVATSISNYVNLILYFSWMKKKIGDDWMRELYPSLLKTGTATAVMTAGVLAGRHMLGPWLAAGGKGALFSFAALVLAGAIVYGTMCLLLKEKTVMELISIVRGKCSAKNAGQ